jgi:hypothetical protein
MLSLKKSTHILAMHTSLFVMFPFKYLFHCNFQILWSTNHEHYNKYTSHMTYIAQNIWNTQPKLHCTEYVEYMETGVKVHKKPKWSTIHMKTKYNTHKNRIKACMKNIIQVHTKRCTIRLNKVQVHRKQNTSIKKLNTST